MERICSLYISEKHLSVTILEYAKREIDKGVKVLIISQDDITRSIKDIKKMKECKNVKKCIKFLGETDRKILQELDNVTVILQGNEQFILKTEEIFKELMQDDKKKINIVSCYNLRENINVEDVVSKYDKVLNTTGIVDVKSTEKI